FPSRRITATISFVVNDAGQYQVRLGREKAVPQPLSALGFTGSFSLFGQIANDAQLPEVSPILRYASWIGLLVATICYIVLIVKTFQHERTTMGVTLILTFFCFCCPGFITGLVHGWMRAGAWKMKSLMTVYTLAVLVWAGAIAAMMPTIIEAGRITYNQ